MKRGILLTVIVLALMMVLFIVPMSAAPEKSEKTPPETNSIENSINQAWLVGPTMCFDWTRFDGEYYPGTGLVYFMGGRYGGDTIGTIFSFNPLTYECLPTGTVMPTPISNYTINLVNDGSHDLLCTFGGRNPTGGSTLDVQCYDPNANTVSVVAQLPVAWTGYTPGAQVVVDNQVYIFGGFNPTIGMTARTDKYDPVNHSFTQLGDLSLARSYIMATAVDGMIYAFGGDTWDGGSLIAQTRAEKMDPALGTWDDAALADLPIAGDEGRAYGFDTGAPYVFANQIVIATLAQWSGASNEVILYDIATNTYDMTFPNLVNGRRNHAGVFIPIPSPDPNDGLPGMWVFGGYFTGDNPPYAPSEFYPMEALGSQCNVLLVDDDWDQYSGQPFNGTGTYYYTSTLEALGYDYTRWDVWTQGDPALANLEPYDVVLWFTGYAWNGVITSTNEADLTAYLNGGGNLILTSEDYLYEAGLSTFGQNYLGISSYTDDMEEIDVVGNAGDPIGDGLGPYSLVVPTSWPPNQPMYTDYIDPVISSSAPFKYQASGSNNSTDTDAGTWKTAFFGWPLEGIGTLAEREEVFGSTLAWMCGTPATGEFYLTPPGQTGSGIAGETVTYTVSIINSLGFDESFDISYSSLWPTTGPMTVTVPDGDTVEFIVTVDIPTGGNCYDSDVATLTATAISDPQNQKNAQITTLIDPPGLGSLQGHIYDANTNLGIENAHLAIYVAQEWIEVYTNADGVYTIPNIGACTYDGDVNAFGYFDQYNLDVDVSVGAPTVFDLYLDASWPVLTGDPVSVVVRPDSTATYNLRLKNEGTGDLYFHVTEVPSGTYPLPVYVDPKMPVGVDARVYSDLKASPDGTTRFIVYMREQADLSAAYEMDWSARGQYVLDTLKAVADQTQSSIRSSLSRAGTSYETRYIVNSVVVDGSLALVNDLISRPEVGYIGPNTAVPAPAPVTIDEISGVPQAIEWNIQKVMADQVWSTLGVTGQGIVLSNMDTGVQWDHLALINQYRGWDGAIADHNFNWWDPYNQNTLEPTDSDGHGTHTMGTMIGSDNPSDPLNAANAIGVAPGAKWLACDGFDNNTGYGYDAELLECAEFLLAPWDLNGANANPAMRPDIINNSWSGGQGQWWYNQAIYAWRAAGIMGVFANSNDGPNCETAGSPGDNANMLAVGATDSNDLIAGFSSRGPANITGIKKPDLSAPGVNIRSSVPGSSYQGGWGGTSMATPHVAGAVALIWSAVPELRGDVQVTTWILEQSAFGLTTTQGCGGDLPDEIPNNVFGWGRINVLDATTLAQSFDWDTPWLSVAPMNGTISPSAAQLITLSFDTTGLVFGQCYLTDLKLEYNDPYVTEEIVPVELCVGIPSYNFSLPIIMR